MANLMAFNQWKKVKDKLCVPKCTMCNKEKPFQCATCASASYCSKECQKADWPLHKLLCKGYKLFGSVLRPDNSHKIGLLFPVDEETPRLVFIPTTPESHQITEGPNNTALHLTTTKDLEKILDGPANDCGMMSHNPIRAFGLTHELHFARPANRVNLPVNKCALKFLGEKDKKLGDFWCGPIVVTREIDYGGGAEVGELEPEDSDTHFIRYAVAQEVQDLTLADVRHAVDGLRAIPEKFMETFEEKRQANVEWAKELLGLLKLHERTGRRKEGMKEFADKWMKSKEKVTMKEIVEEDDSGDSREGEGDEGDEGKEGKEGKVGEEVEEIGHFALRAAGEGLIDID